MPTEKNSVEVLMKACQRGVTGKGPAIEVANNLLAECYGALGKLVAENEALRKDAERYKAIRDEIPHLDLGDAIRDAQTAQQYDDAVDAAMAKETQP
ncbi:hypothetical protein NJF44_01105 [Pseudomonas guariconensis]|uniref:hypothetical protein n=1 Tax=Pseudomonas TaxID=286 RepID=UPI0020973DAC|nr:MULTISPECIES: hypothetical protein [Pseudomonas]MCO7513759.1 hypothetical protein [Pseudomonas putida]MCO7603840.1 hypothetical protein [Pseudomonas guariconensis]